LRNIHFWSKKIGTSLWRTPHLKSFSRRARRWKTCEHCT
jgi:hypothetical protein